MSEGHTHLSVETRKIRTGELILATSENRQLLALGERRQRACVKRANQVRIEKTEHNGLYSGTDTSIC
jgi:hypothetical protein